MTPVLEESGKICECSLSDKINRPHHIFKWAGIALPRPFLSFFKMSEGARNVLKRLKMRDACARTFTLRVPCSPYFARVQGDKTMTDKKKNSIKSKLLSSLLFDPF